MNMNLNSDSTNRIGDYTVLSVSFEEYVEPEKLTSLSCVMSRAGIENTGLISSQEFYRENEFLTGSADYQLIDSDDFDEDYYKTVIESHLDKNVLLNHFSMDHEFPF